MSWEQRKGTKPSWAAQAEWDEGSARPGGAAGRKLTGCQELRRGGRARVLGKTSTGRVGCTAVRGGGCEGWCWLWPVGAAGEGMVAQSWEESGP